MSADSSKSSRNIIAVCLLLAVAVAGYYVFRPSAETQPKGTKAQYVASLAPVVEEAKNVAGQLNGEPPGPELFEAMSNLESAWAAVRTGPGYDRQTHDDFIIVFGSYVTRLKSAGMIWERLNSDSMRSEGDKTELLFMLQSLHGSESAAQLASKRGLSIDALLSGTNLVFEVTNALAQAPAILENAVQLYDGLVSNTSNP